MSDIDTSVGQAQRVLTLKTFPLFQDLGPNDLAVLAQIVKPRFYSAHRALLRANAPVRSMHFVVRGEVSLDRAGKASQRIGAHGVVGGLAVLAREAESARAIALEDTVTLELSKEDMEDVIEDNFSILAAMLKTLAREQIRARLRLSPHAGYDVHPTQAASEFGPELGLVDKIVELRRTMDFADTRIEALAALAQDAEVVEIAPGRLVWSIGDVADHMLVLFDGLLDCTNAEAYLAFQLGPCAFAGGADAVAGDPRWYEARARTRLRALRIRSESVFDVIEDNLDMAVEMVRVFAKTTRALQDRMSQLEPSAPIA